VGKSSLTTPGRISGETYDGAEGARLGFKPQSLRQKDRVIYMLYMIYVHAYKRSGL